MADSEYGITVVILIKVLNYKQKETKVKNSPKPPVCKNPTYPLTRAYRGRIPHREALLRVQSLLGKIAH